MAVSIKHNFVSPVADGGESDIVGPNEWNDDHQVTGLATVAESNDYNDLDNKPTLATVATTGAYSDLSGTPSLATVATTGAYSDLTGTPTLGTAAALDVGTTAGDVVQVQTGGKLPALDGSDLTNLPGGGDMSKSTYDPNNKAADAFSQDNMVDGTTNKNYTATEQTKLSGIEASADVTDAVNVAAAGAFMKAADDADDVTEGATHLFLTTSERSAISGLASTYQPLDSDLTAIAALTPTNDDIVQRKAGAWTNRSMSQLATDLGLASTYQPLDSDLTSWAGVTRASGFDTFAATPSSANLASLLTDETGSGTVIFSSAVREKLGASRTYYVRTDGSDSNDGLSNSSGGAFLTPQKAWNVAITLDLAGFGVTIQFGDGTYTGGLSMSVPPVGGVISIVGNTSTPGNVIFSTTSKDAISLSCPVNVPVSGIKVVTTTSGFGLHSQAAGGKIALGAGMQFGACAQAHMFAENGGIISCFSAYTINGAAPVHFATQKSGIIDLFGYTVTLSGSLNFSTAFATAQSTGIVSAPSLTFTGGTITGNRYLVSLNGLIDTSGGGASYFPGNSAGSTSTGGQYA